MFDEKLFTPHADTGWKSWDEWSPERDFCRFVGMLQRMLQPAVTVETGVGVGRLTEHLDPTVGDYLGFEADPAWRRPPADPTVASPGAGHIALADLLILDSDPRFRLAELDLWVEHGKPGSVCVMHDCGNGHAESTLHAALGRAAVQTNMPGLMLRNPRGGWMGIHS